MARAPMNNALYGKIAKLTNAIRKQIMRFTGHYWRTDNELMSSVFTQCSLCKPLHSKRFKGRSAKHQWNK